MIVICDIDEVLLGFVNAIIEVHSVQYPDDQIGEITDYFMWPFFKHGDQMKDNYINNELYRRLVHSKCKPIPGALQGYRELCKNFIVYVVTARPNTPTDQKVTRQVLDNYGFNLHDKLIFSREKHLLGDLLIDDSVENLQKFVDYGKIGICIDAPWNQAYSGPRVKNISEACKMALAYRDSGQIAGMAKDSILA